jgi:hypothetical protein
MVCGRPQRGNMIYHFGASAVVCTQLQYTVADDHVRCDMASVYMMFGWDYIRYFVMVDNDCTGSYLIWGANKTIWFYM